MPVSVLERLLTALSAAGLLTSFPEDDGVLVSGLVLMPPIVLPDEPRLRALSVAGVFEPPVPFVVLLEADPAELPPEDAPPDVCAKEGVVTSASEEMKPIARNFMGAGPFG
ncbi:MAG: hypothetical protein V4517_05160 [Pseudomonadota bacterium]